MSLFDDLLNKVQPAPIISTDSDFSGTSGSSGSSGGQDPLINNAEWIITSDSTPIITNIDILEPPVPPPIPAPIAVPMIDISDVQDIIKEEVSTPTIPIADTISFIETQESIPEASADLALDFTTESNTSSPLFEMTREPASNDTTIESSLTNEFMSEGTETQSPLIDSFVTESIQKEVVFHNTAEYLGHALIEVGALMSNLDAANDAKLSERDEYKEQKEHFAELETRAEEEHQKMLIERAHAKKMKTYLEHEQAKSIELTKSTLAVNDEQFAIAA